MTIFVKQKYLILFLTIEYRKCQWTQINQQLLKLRLSYKLISNDQVYIYNQRYKMRRQSMIGLNKKQEESENESFDASQQIRISRKNRRKIKKIIHNCCVLVKKPDGKQEILLKQFLIPCRFKTAKSLAKKAKQIQQQKDNHVAQELLAQIKNFSIQKQFINSNQSQENIVLQSSKIDNQISQTSFTVDSQTQFPTIFYIVPTMINFNII